MHFIIIDDDESFGRSLKRLLNARGLTADQYLSAQSFLESGACRQKNAIAVVDIHMPGCGGFDLVDKMNYEGCSMPVIMITGQPYPDAEESALKLGAIGFLRKPFSEESLLNLIASHHEQSENGELH